MPLTREEQDFVHSATSYFRQKREFTIRDEFAIAAMQTLLSTCWEKKTYEDIAQLSYEMADTMLQARTNKKGK